MKPLFLSFSAVLFACGMPDAGSRCGVDFFAPATSQAKDCTSDALALRKGVERKPSPPPATVWRPTPGTSWQIQFSGTFDASVAADVFDLDLYDTPKSRIDQLHARGSRVICYFSGGSYEDWRPDAADFPSSVLGKPLDGWPGESWLDARQLSLLRPIMAKRLDLAVEKGCDAVDSDNMDGYTQKSGFPISYTQQLAYNRMIAEEAHRRGLSIGLKNDLDQIDDLVDQYDFAVNEQCVEYDECRRLEPFIAANKAVLGIEYTGTASAVCPQANRLRFDTLIKHLALDSYRVACRPSP